MIRRKLLVSSVTRDPKLGALIVPWTSKIHTWVGYAYMFDADVGRDDVLVYFVPGINGNLEYHVHVTPCDILEDENGDVWLEFETPPDPDTDPLVSHFSVRPPPT